MQDVDLCIDILRVLASQTVHKCDADRLRYRTDGYGWVWLARLAKYVELDIVARAI